MIRFGYSELHSEVDPHSKNFQPSVDVEATFELITDRGVIYTEVHFPVVELATDLRRWSRRRLWPRDDFEWDSQSTPEPGWVWIRRREAGYRVGSIHQDEIDPNEYPWEEVRAAIVEFSLSVERDFEAAFGRGLSRRD